MRVSVLLLVASLAACGSAPLRTTLDPQIAGKTYRGTTIPFGPLKGRLEAQGPGEPPYDDVEMLLGFRGTGGADTTAIVNGRLLVGGARREAELVGRHRVRGTAEGCPWERGAELSTEYLFNGPLYPDAWTCVALTFKTPERQPDEALELNLDPINVGGELVRVIPIRLVVRPAE